MEYQEGGQALIIAVRICAQSVRSLCACAQTSVEVLGLFLFAHSNAHRLLCSPLRTDVCAHPHRCAQTSVRICARLCASVRMRTDVGAHRMRTECAQPFYSVRICAHSVRMRTTTICCAQCAQPLRTAILCCAQSVRILCACSQTSVRSAQTLAVRSLCALRTDGCGSFTPCLCAAHRLRTDAHSLSTLLLREDMIFWEKCNQVDTVCFCS